jgi:hypothetical protein
MRPIGAVRLTAALFQLIRSSGMIESVCRMGDFKRGRMKKFNLAVLKQTYRSQGALTGGLLATPPGAGEASDLSDRQ